MQWTIRPSTLAGTIPIPPSKSHTIRSLVIATLANGESVIRKPLITGDGASALNAARSLGADIILANDELIVKGIGGKYNLGDDVLFLGNSGTGTNLFTSVASLGTRLRTFDGDASLRSRPVKPLLEALSCLGVSYTPKSETQDLPFAIRGPLQGGTTEVDGISSQFVSSLLLSCPLAPNATEITVHNLHERPYVELTLWWLRKQGVLFTHNNDLTSFHITGNQSYKPFKMVIPSDFSSATFAAVAAAVTNSCLELTGLDFGDPQGDKEVFDVVKRFGAGVVVGNNGVTVKGTGSLISTTVDCNNIPDALPALSVLACMAEGETHFVNIGHARIKETDRITVMRTELAKMGACIEEEPDKLVIRKSDLYGAKVHGHHDHRVVMALALAGMVAEGVTIIDTAEAADVTYPSFVDDFKKLGANIETL